MKMPADAISDIVLVSQNLYHLGVGSLRGVSGNVRDSAERSFPQGITCKRDPSTSRSASASNPPRVIQTSPSRAHRARTSTRQPGSLTVGEQRCCEFPPIDTLTIYQSPQPQLHSSRTFPTSVNPSRSPSMGFTGQPKARLSVRSGPAASRQIEDPIPTLAGPGPVRGESSGCSSKNLMRMADL